MAHDFICRFRPPEGGRKFLCNEVFRASQPPPPTPRSSAKQKAMCDRSSVGSARDLFLSGGDIRVSF
jgi:hypothetical protein